MGRASGNCHLFTYIKNTGCQASITDNKNVLSLYFFLSVYKNYNFCKIPFRKNITIASNLEKSSKRTKNNYCTLVLSLRFLALSISARKSFYSINVDNIKNIKYFSIFKISSWDIYYFNNRYECFGSYLYLFS